MEANRTTELQRNGIEVEILQCTDLSESDPDSTAPEKEKKTLPRGLGPPTASERPEALYLAGVSPRQQPDPRHRKADLAVLVVVVVHVNRRPTFGTAPFVVVVVVPPDRNARSDRYPQDPREEPGNDFRHVGTRPGNIEQALGPGQDQFPARSGLEGRPQDEFQGAGGLALRNDGARDELQVRDLVVVLVVVDWVGVAQNVGEYVVVVVRSFRGVVVLVFGLKGWRSPQFEGRGRQEF